MNRNPSTKLIAVLVCFLIVAAALVGCGGGGEATNNPQPQKDGQVDTDQPDAYVPEAGNETGVDAADAGLDAEADTDADVPDVQPEAESDADAEPDADCEHSVCDPCSPEGLLCGGLICWDGLWAMNSDSGISHAGCPQIDAGPDADADVPDVQPEAESDADQPEAGEDADSGMDSDVPDVNDSGSDSQVEETGTFDAPPPPPEICDNNVDDDGDGKKDCVDTECASAQNCQPDTCNGLDDNADGIPDNGPGMTCVLGSQSNCTVNGKAGYKVCQSPSCTFGACQTPPEICDNNVDDDGDGKKDCADPLCASASNCQCVNGIPGDPCGSIGMYSCNDTWRCNCQLQWDDPVDGGFWCLDPENCNNGTDDDGDGYKDCLDTDCYGNPVCDEHCSDGADNDGNGLTDCDDNACISAPECQSDVCNGLDDNSDGVPDNGPGMTCVGTSGNVQTCITACGSQGNQLCNTVTCTWNACVAPAKETKCGDSKDDDCDGFIDCVDPDCWGTAACPHNFGTCGSVQLTGDALNCSAWSTQQLPKRVLRGCAFSDSDQWAVTADYDQITVMRLVSGSWTAVPLPVPGKPGGSDIFCVPGTSTVYAVYNQYNSPQGSIVLAKWTGSQFQRLNTPSAEGYNATTGWAFDSSNVWIFGFKWLGERDTAVFKWNGTSLTKTPYLQADDRVFYTAQFYGTGPTNMYSAGWEQVSQTSYAVLAHWDGVSWAKVSLPVFEGGFESLHGTSACDVMVGGYYLDVNQNSQAVSFQRNGSSWVSQTYPGHNELTSLVKRSSFKYLVTAQSFDGWDWIADIGTSNGDSTLDWFHPTEDFYKPRTSWSIPGSDILMVAGEGSTGYIMSSSCQ